MRLFHIILGFFQKVAVVSLLDLRVARLRVKCRDKWSKQEPLVLTQEILSLLDLVKTGQWCVCVCV